MSEYICTHRTWGHDYTKCVQRWTRFMHISIHEVCHLLPSTFESFSGAHGQGVHAPVDVACKRSELRFDIPLKPFLINTDKPETKALLQFGFHYGDSHCRPWTPITLITVLDWTDAHSLLQQKIREVAVSIKLHSCPSDLPLPSFVAYCKVSTSCLDPLHLFRSPGIFLSPFPFPWVCFKVLLSVP